MKKRLLFVDDDPNVLNGLRRSLHRMREEWEMEFVDDAAAALAQFEKQAYDAIISDMRMPGMDGADLLEEVKRRYPDTVRIILSGQSGRSAVFRSIAPAHQFLAKPCDPQELTSRLGQAFAMRDLAQRIGSAENGGKGLLEECFTAGLLHDLGKVILLAELPRETLRLYTTAAGACPESERARLGCTHAEVGAYLMSIWGLPLPLVHAVAHHHTPYEAEELKFSSLTAVHAADAIISERDPSLLNHDGGLDLQYLRRLGLGDKESAWRGLCNHAATKAAGGNA